MKQKDQIKKMSTKFTKGKDFMNLIKLIFLIPLLILIHVEANAQINICGEIEDAATNLPLYKARVSLHHLDSTIAKPAIFAKKLYVLKDNKHISISYYSIPVKKTRESYLIHAQRPGYEDVWEKYELTDTTKGFVNVPTIQLRVNDSVAAYAPPIQIKGYVEDAYLKKPIPDVEVAITTLDSCLIDAPVSSKTYIYQAHANSPLEERQAFTLEVPTLSQQYYVHAYKPGYSDVWKKFFINDTTQKVLNLPTIKMRKLLERQLGEAVVTATRVKMYYKGDTLVYDAAAFKLPDGSMLDALINQLPGVTMNNAGEIFVHGKKVKELLLGSRSFMHGDKKVLMENLPYYTVKDIKVYNRTSDKSVALGYDVDGKDYVMDVQLKKEYRQGYIANIEGAIGTQNRWLARAFGLFFNDNMRVAFVGNLNNVSESRHIGQSGFWSPGGSPNSLKITRSGKAEIANFSNDNKIKNNFIAEYLSTSDNQQMRQRREQILVGRKPTSLQQSNNLTDTRKIAFNNQLTLLKPFFIDTKLEFEHTKRNLLSNYDFQQWDDSLVASNNSHGLGIGKDWNVRMETNGAFNIGHKQKYMDFTLLMEHNQSSHISANEYATRQFVMHSYNNSYNSKDFYNRTTWGSFDLMHELKFSPFVSMKLKNNFFLINSSTHDNLYHPDSLMLPSELEALQASFDPNNSYDQCSKAIQDVLSAKLFVRKEAKNRYGKKYNYTAWEIGLEIPVRKEQLDYERGTIDTLVQSNTIFVKPSVTYRLPWKNNWNRLDIRASYSASSPSLNNKINYRDDSNPLVVTMGNPSLKGRAYSSLNMGYSFDRGKGHQFNASTRFRYVHRDVAQSTSYNPLTGVYTYMPKNVSGAYDVDGTLAYNLSLPESKWAFQVQSSLGYHNSVDHSMLSGETVSHRNVVGTWSQNDNLWLKYGKKGFEVSLHGNLTWRRSVGQMRDFATLNVYDYKYGLNAFYTIPRIKTTLRADATMYSRRGYSSTSLNTDDFIMNASLSQPLFKARVILNIEAYDILHQLSSTKYEVNAQGRTETWYRTLPNYVMFHLVYRWNKNPKKR